MMDRTTYRRLARRQLENPADSWIAPEHAKMCRMKRTREHRLPDGTVLVAKGTLILPEPECIRAQRETERRKRLDAGEF